MQKKQMKILVVGAGDYFIYETAIYEAFLESGYKNAELFTWKEFLSSRPFGKLSELSAKAQNKFQFGPRIHKINRELIKTCERMKPDLVFVYSGILIYGKTIRKIKKNSDLKVFYYNNDDPFAEFYPKYHWRHYKNAVKECDYNFVFRHKNCKDIADRYGKKAEILRSYYIKENNFPVAEAEKIKDTPDVIFLGHYEADERSEYIDALAKEGIKVGVPKEHYEAFLAHTKNIVPVENNRRDYNKYLCSCKIPLIFLSKINHDTYTSRCFEIPAAGAFIFCPYNEDMDSMFAENKEAVYYRTKEEFVEKLCYYLAHDDEREAIAKAGRERLLKDGHEAVDRAEQIIEAYKKFQM